MVYPAMCVLCRIPLLVNEIYVCLECKNNMKKNPSPNCQRCASPLPPFGPRNTTCHSCRFKKPPFDRGWSLFLYRYPVNKILYQVKFGGKVWLLNLFASAIKENISFCDYQDYDAITPVPPDPSRKRERGFNQAQVIAKMISKYSVRNVKVISLLEKKKRTKPQSMLSRHERYGNLKGSMATRSHSFIKGKRVLLVDDVVTTGSTLSECAQLLKLRGAKTVDFFTVARAQLS
jgi:ComF family protein